MKSLGRVRDAQAIASDVTSSHESVRRCSLGLSVVLFLEFPEFMPAGVLLGFGGVRIFVALEPKAEPIDARALRSETLPWIRKRMSAVPNYKVFNWFVQIP